MTKTFRIYAVPLYSNKTEAEPIMLARGNNEKEALDVMWRDMASFMYIYNLEDAYAVEVKFKFEEE